MSETSSDARVDLIVFRIGRARYGADASQVTRIVRATPPSRCVEALGVPEFGQRALCFETDRGEEQLCIDSVEGVQSAPVIDLRRLPLAAGPSRGVLGVWLEGGERPIVLLDLPETIAAARGGQ